MFDFVDSYTYKWKKQYKTFLFGWERASDHG